MCKKCIYKSHNLHKVLVDHSLKIQKEFKKVKETRDSRTFYQNELHKACFKHDTAYEDFKNLNRRTTAHELLSDKAFNINKNLK